MAFIPKDLILSCFLALCGDACVIEALSGNVLDYGVLQKFCFICKKFGQDKTHKCSINWVGCASGKNNPLYLNFRVCKCNFKSTLNRMTTIYCFVGFFHLKSIRTKTVFAKLFSRMLFSRKLYL